jgi:hypothetical protein
VAAVALVFRQQVGAAEHHCRGARAQRQRGQLAAVVFLGDARQQHALHGLFIDQVAGLGVDHQRVLDVAALDHAAGDLHAVDEGQARVGDVEVHAGVGKPEVAAHDAGGGRLQEIARHRGVDQQADLLARNAAFEQGLFGRQRGGVRGLHATVPQAAGVDAGDVAEHVDANAQAVRGRTQAIVDFDGGQRMRRIDMHHACDGNVLEQHWGDDRWRANPSTLQGLPGARKPTPSQA